jgi:DNA-binding PucR family transcriptional regulator
VSDLQRVVDGLGRSTRSAVAVTDGKGRILAYSSHEGEVDEVRRASILTRQTPAASLAWSRSYGIETSEGPVRIPANAELGMARRLCVPVRHDGRLLGYLWLVEDEAGLPDAALPAVQVAASSVADALHREQLLEVIERGHERELLRDLLSDVAGQREQAADELVERDLFAAGPTAVLVARPVRDRLPMSRGDSEARAAVEHALGKARQGLGRRQALQLVRHDHGLLVLAPDARRGDAAGLLATALHEALEAALTDLPGAGWRAVVGVGEVVPELAQTLTSHGQALRAAEAAALLESFGPVTRWSDLGVYQTLMALPLGELGAASLHPGLRTLMGLRDADIWLDTLERWFDLGGDARAAAVSLSVQRGTLYHRLNRIEQLASIDLSRGDDRLALHLGLKLMRLAGLRTQSG